MPFNQKIEMNSTQYIKAYPRINMNTTQNTPLYLFANEETPEAYQALRAIIKCQAITRGWNDEKRLCGAE